MKNGTHKARATSVELGYSKNNTEQAAISLQITEGEAQGESIAYYAYFSDKAQKFAIAALRALGWAGDDLGTLTIADLSAEVDIVVDSEEYNGELQQKVKWVNALGSGVASCKNKMTPAQRAEFGARMRGNCIETATTKTTAAKPVATTPVSAKLTDKDDLPF
jgi:hypothetical protein